VSYSGGWGFSSNGAPSFDFGNIGSQISQITNPVGGTVGTETPEYDFPMGLDRVPDSVRSYFMRSDNGPTGLNEFLQNADPKVIDEFRAAVNGGLIRPKNQAADNIIKGYGGLRAGDQTILGPMMNDMPSGLSPEYWQQANTLIGTMIDAQMKAANASGYFDGMPTIQREQIMGQLAQGWKQQFTNEFLANEQKRAAQAQEGMTQQQINNQNLQAMAGIMGGTVNPQTGQFQQTEQGRQFDTSQSGWLNGQRTLAGEAQDWSQQKDVATAASNPRDYIYAQMLGNARGGLAGQPATNQMQMPYQGGPMTPTGMPNAGGWGTMQSMQSPGVSGAGTMAQNGTPGTPGADGQVQPAGADQWAQMYQQAMAAQNQARTAMMGAQQGAGGTAASALSPGQGSAGMVQGYPGYQGQPGQQAFQAPQAQQPQYTTSAFTQQLLKNRMVPQSGAIQGQGQYMTGQQMQQSLPNLNKIRAQDYMRGNASERQGFGAVASQAGFSDEDTLSGIKSNLTQFKAPTAGRMI